MWKNGEIARSLVRLSDAGSRRGDYRMDWDIHKGDKMNGIQGKAKMVEPNQAGSSEYLISISASASFPVQPPRQVTRPPSSSSYIYSCPFLCLSPLILGTHPPLCNLSSVVLSSSPMPDMASVSHPQQRQFNPYSSNGGTILAIAGADFTVIAGDTRQSEGYSIQTRYAPKVFRL